VEWHKRRSSWPALPVTYPDEVRFRVERGRCAIWSRQTRVTFERGQGSRFEATSPSSSLPLEVDAQSHEDGSQANEALRRMSGSASEDQSRFRSMRAQCWPGAKASEGRLVEGVDDARASYGVLDGRLAAERPDARSSER